MTRADAPSRLRLTPVNNWPSALRVAWQQAHSPTRTLFAPVRKASGWAPATVRHAEQGIGKLLSFVRATSGAMADDMTIMDLVQQHVLQGFVAHLQAEHLLPATQANYLNGIGLAARALAPTHDWKWIGYGLTALRAQVGKRSLVKDAAISTDQLFLLGKRLFAEAAGRTDLRDKVQSRMARDGLIIALLALRPIRRKNLASLTLGQHVIVEPGGARIAIPASEMKMRKQPYCADWPDQLRDELDLYLERFRPVLLDGYVATNRLPPAGDALWVSERGTRLDDSAVKNQVDKLTLAEFGRSVTLHQFRNCAASTIAVQRPEQIHLVTPVLGHHDPRSRELYIEADQLIAGRRFQASEDSLLADLAAPTRREQRR